MTTSNKFLAKHLFSIKNKICIITGSEGGMGKDISNLLENNGAKVIKVDIKKKNKLNYYQVDLSDKNDLLIFSNKIKKKYDRIDAIINLAGISDPINFEKNFKVNIFSVYYLVNNFLELMKKDGGSIVNITSLNSELGFKNNPGYNSSKGALKLLTKSMAVDYGKYNIRVNNLGPGYVKTNMTRISFQNKISRKKRLNRMIIKRYGNPSDLFGIILYLISGSSKYVTGQDFYIDGGFLSKGI